MQVFPEGRWFGIAGFNASWSYALCGWTYDRLCGKRDSRCHSAVDDEAEESGTDA